MRQWLRASILQPTPAFRTNAYKADHIIISLTKLAILLFSQVLGGIWADKYGGKAVLGFGVLWWSLATALTPLAAQAGLPCLLASRALMGVGEGVAMPAMNNILSR